MLVTDANTKDLKVILKQIPCIHNLGKFRKDKEIVQVLIDSGSEINAMTPVYAIVIGLKVWFTTVRG